MTPGAAKAIFLLCVISWFAIRYPHERRSRRTPVNKNARGLREHIVFWIATTGLGIVPILYVATGFPRFASRPFVGAVAWLGTLSFLAALWLFHRAHHDLGRNWSPSLQLRVGHTLVTTGVYAHIRHPIYAAFWLWAVAQALLLPNWVAGLAGLVGFAILYVLRVGEEERLMLEAFGEEYRSYMNRTARIVPWIR